MSDILDDITILIDCSQCDAKFNITASVVADSHRLLDQGCPGSHYECPASLFAEIVDHQSLRDVATAWRRLEDGLRNSNRAAELRINALLQRNVDDRDRSSGSRLVLTVGKEEPKPPVSAPPSSYIDGIRNVHDAIGLGPGVPCPLDPDRASDSRGGKQTEDN